MNSGSVASRRVVRERQARKMAESLLEAKSLELYEANRQLKDLAVSLEKQVEERTRELNEKRNEALKAANAKSEFLAMMSHEIRTPMNGVIGTLSLLEDSDLSADQRDLVAVANDSAENLLMLINDILDFSKIEAGKLSLEQIDFNLAQVVGATITSVVPLAGEKGLEIRTSVCSGADKDYSGDPYRLRQILTNLLSNAIKFTERGFIRVSVIELEGDAPGHFEFKVEDTGAGIASDRRRAIFNAFSQSDSSTTRRYGGTGLGLAICAQLVDLMGGSIGVESEEGVGSIFSFDCQLSVPRLNRRTGNNESAERKYDQILDGTRVLLVEDNPTNQKVQGAFLRKLNVAFDTACNGQEAVDAFQSATYDYDAILMDAQMPVLDGFQATRRIRAIEQQENRSRIPIIALTASAAGGAREECIESGMDDYLTKPVRKSDLGLVLHRWTRELTETAER